MSVDLSEFMKMTAPRKQQCPISVALASLEPGDAEKLAAAVAHDNYEIGAGAISRWLSLRGIKASTNSVTSHRRATCSCND